MLAARLTAVRKLELVDAPIPQPGDGEVLVAVKVTGICASDVHYYAHGGIGGQHCVYPQSLGHECSGEVVQAPEGSSFTQGDRVAVEPGRYCGKCEHCIEGRYNRCPNVRFLGGPGQAGAFQEYLALHESQLVKIPDGMRFDEAALLEPLGVGYHAVTLSALKPGDGVAVFGAGAIGLCTLALAKACGAGETFLFDRVQHRLDFAEKHVAPDHLINVSSINPLGYIKEKTGGRLVDIVYEAAGSAQTFGWAFEASRIGGKVMLIGIPPEDFVGFNPHTLRRREILVINVRRSNRALHPCISLIERKTVTIAPMATHHFPLRQIAGAMRVAETYEDGAVRVMVSI
ncbi:MAG: alcohol dehydrogenase catalytic domain-containing protein [Chitinispirillaceae bacterium]|nr:alcohol dehydrogenase catalytic domain-containing protein [Chitinispirillaceae bacterium]